MTTYDYKIKKYLGEEIKDFINPTILEFGVKEGRSTKLFLDLCEKKMENYFLLMLMTILIYLIIIGGNLYSQETIILNF